MGSLESRDGGQAPVTAEEIREGSILTVGLSSVVLDDVGPHAADEAVGEVVETTFGAIRDLHHEGGDVLRRATRSLLEPELAGVTRSIRYHARGHVRLLDFDDGVRLLDVLRHAGRMDGVRAVFESSPGSYHVWALGVGDLDAQLLAALRSACDPMHVQQSAKRGRFIIRVAPKWYVDDDGRPAERYKDAPELLDVTVSDSDVPQSAPHLDVLEARAAESDRGPSPEELREEIDDADLELVGDRVIRSEYLTMDDATKRRGL